MTVLTVPRSEIAEKRKLSLRERVQSWWAESDSRYYWVVERDFYSGGLSRKKFRERYTDAKIKRYIRRNGIDGQERSC
jgi:hypothetical protein